MPSVGADGTGRNSPTRRAAAVPSPPVPPPPVRPEPSGRPAPPPAFRERNGSEVNRRPALPTTTRRAARPGEAPPRILDRSRPFFRSRAPSCRPAGTPLLVFLLRRTTGPDLDRRPAPPPWRNGRPADSFADDGRTRNLPSRRATHVLLVTPVAQEAGPFPVRPGSSAAG